jgi:hypothetical protein
VGGILGEVVSLVGIQDQIVELLGRDHTLSPSIREKQLFARTVIGVRQDGLGALSEAPDILLPLRGVAQIKYDSAGPACPDLDP